MNSPATSLLPQDILTYSSPSTKACPPLSILQVFTFYEPYLHDFYSRTPDLNSALFQNQLEALLSDGFGYPHLFAPFLAPFQFTPQVVVANCERLQKQWLREMGLPQINQPDWKNQILKAQIELAKPDILYLLNPLDFESRFLRSLSHRPKFIVGWRAAEIPQGIDWSEFDVILSHLSTCRTKALECGAKRECFFHPGGSKLLADAVASQSKLFDLVFSGQWSRQHQKRNSLITELSEHSQRQGLLLGLFLCALETTLPPIVEQFNRGSVWGINMFRALKSGKIVVNAEIDLAANEAGNLRLFETTSCGSFLLTEHHPNISTYFEPGKEIETYKTKDELLEKLTYYLSHPEEREKIALAGQKRCLEEYSMEKMASKLNHIIRESLTGKLVCSTPSVSSLPQTNPLSSNAPSPDSTPKKINTISDHESRLKNVLEFLQNRKGVEALREVEPLISRGIAGEGLHYLHALCLNSVGRHEEALEAVKTELLTNSGYQPARNEFERLSKALCKKTIPHLPPEQRSYNSSLDSSTLLNIQNATHNYTYKGVPMIKNPFDLALYPLLLWNIKPKTIIEIGSKNGGSAIWLADLLGNFETPGHVYSIDIVKVKDVIHPKVTFLEGNGRELWKTITPEFIESLPRPLLVIEDADHSYETSSAVLNFFHPHLRSEEYIIIEDGIISDLQKDQACNSGPHRGLKEFLTAHAGEYDIDAQYCDYFGYNYTWCTNGFLRKKKYALNPTIPKSIIKEFNADDPAPSGIESQMSQNERFQLYSAIRDLPLLDGRSLRFIEIGSYAGASLQLISKALGRVNPRFEGFAVEPDGNPQFYEIVKNLSSNVSHLKMRSHEAAAKIGEIFSRDGNFAQFIFVDGDHTYVGVKQDILDYYPLLRPGGVMCFHDYLPPLNDQNREAIHFHHAGNEPGIRKACCELMEQTYHCELLNFSLLYPTDPTQTQPHLPVIPGVFSTFRAYRKTAG